MRSIIGTLYNSDNIVEIIDLLFKDDFYCKVSYRDRNGNNHRWERIIKGNDSEETRRFKLANVFKNASVGQSLWVDAKMSIYLNIIKKDREQNKRINEKDQLYRWYKKCRKSMKTTENFFLVLKDLI